MPKGVYDRRKKTVVCKKCPGSQFKNLSGLRRHQWAQHPEMFTNLKNSARRRGAGKKRRAEAALVPLVSLEQSSNGDMRVSDLLGQLRNQQKFINDVVTLVSDILNTHQEAQKHMTKKETR